MRGADGADGHWRWRAVDTECTRERLSVLLWSKLETSLSDWRHIVFKAPWHSRAGLLRPFPFSPSAPGVAYHRSARRSDRRNRVRTTRQPHLDPLEERQLPSGYSVANMGSFGGTYGIVLGINSQGAAV